MELNGDGHIDILSGSYSRMGSSMAGLFHVLYGTGEGTFRAPEVLKGTDGEPLIMPAGEDGEGMNDPVLNKICTRPTAVDIDGDGDLDIVAGNFGGTFFVFEGLGNGKFEPKAKPLPTVQGTAKVPLHSDPVFVDWDGDDDLDLISGSTQAVHLLRNEGTATKPRFAAAETIFEAAHEPSEGLVFGDAHVTAPQMNLRVWIDDVNGDGRFDLLVGDSVRLNFPAKGLDEASCRKKNAEWEQAVDALMKQQQKAAESGKPEDMQAASKKVQKHYQARENFLRTEATGFVWVLFQKPSGER